MWHIWHSGTEKECNFNILHVPRVWRWLVIYTLCIKLLNHCDCLYRIANLLTLQLDFSLMLPLWIMPAAEETLPDNYTNDIILKIVISSSYCQSFSSKTGSVHNVKPCAYSLSCLSQPAACHRAGITDPSGFWHSSSAAVIHDRNWRNNWKAPWTIAQSLILLRNWLSCGVR